MFKTDKRLFLSLFSVWIVLFICFTFFDLSFSQAIYRGKSSVFAHFFEIWGETPAFLVLIAAGNVLIYSRTVQDRKVKFAVVIIGTFSILSGGIGGGLVASSRMTGSPIIYLTAALILTLFLSFLIQFWLSQVNEKTMRHLRTVAWASMLIIVAELVVTHLLKIVWGRMRYREMLDDISQFTPWFRLRGIQENGIISSVYKSFPSGHSANAWSGVAFVLFVPLKRTWRLCCLSLTVIWGLCTSLSRVIYGAHFATDVLMGAFISMLCFYMISKKYRLSIVEERSVSI